MPSTDLVELPRCPNGHGRMVFRPPATPEQAFVGANYVCPPGPVGESCSSSALFPSTALLDQLCRCPPCPGRGNDGHGMNHCAECCFGTGVVAELGCPKHWPAPAESRPTTPTERTR